MQTKQLQLQYTYNYMLNRDDIHNKIFQESSCLKFNIFFTQTPSQ